MKRLILSALILFFLFHLSVSNNKTILDSLYNVLNQNIHDTTRISTLLKISDAYHFVMSDSSLKYSHTAFKLLDKNINKYDEEDVDKSLVKLKAKALISEGIAYLIQSNHDKGINNHLEAVEILLELNDMERIARCFNNIGLAYHYQGNYELSIEYYLKSLEIREELGHIEGMGATLLNIGNIYYAQQNLEKAFEYYQQLYDIGEEFGDEKNIATSCVNIGIVHTDLGEYDKAMEYFKRALKIQKELGIDYDLSYTYANIGDLYLNQENYYAAKTYFLKSLKIRLQTKDKKGIIYCYNGLATVHGILADEVRNQDKILWKSHLDSALYFGEEAYQLSLEIGVVKRQNQAAEILKEAYNKLGNYTKALKYAELYILTRDSLFSEEKTKALTEMQTKYETDKKEQQIKLQETQLLAKDARIKKQNLLRNALIIGLVGVLIIIVLVVYAYQQKKKSNKLITKQKKQLTDSINYAAFIQEAMLPDNEILKKNFADYFVFFQPREQIGGDFYWIKEVNEYTIIAVADCTGHGVPGAMLSMLGISILNELVRREEIESPAELLEQLRVEMKFSLKQDSNNRGLRDGMDIAVCVINNATHQMQYAGANNPMFVLSNDELKELKPTNNPIGIYLSEEKFENHEFELDKGDLIYMFSDGFYDQFGGEENKKLLISNFKNLLVENSKQILMKQKEILELAFNNWKGEGVQIDDVLVLGIRV